MDTKLEAIKQFADESHGTQMRKYNPDRYIVHPERVMRICMDYNNDIAVHAAALLHDVLEDTPVTKDQVSNFLSTLLSPAEVQRTINHVVDLTDVFIKKDYPHMNRRARKQKEAERLAKTHPDAQTIKYADILDNTLEITKHDPSFAPRFLQECRQLLKVMDKGDAELRKIAMGQVQNGLNGLKNTHRN